MNPTHNQITECDDEKQLCEWAAVYCMGWSLDVEYDDWLYHGSAMMGRQFYQPTSPTEKGESQCWRLARKYGLSVDFETGEIVGPGVELRDLDLQIAVVKAALLCAIGD